MNVELNDIVAVKCTPRSSAYYLARVTKARINSKGEREILAVQIVGENFQRDAWDYVGTIQGANQDGALKLVHMQWGRLRQYSTADDLRDAILAVME